jgi:16S rRNA (cytidine1402-2'-O)-methyltransferase
MLYVIATPIGNLEDISLRALRILKEVDLIVCEDTRVTRKILSHYDIHNDLFSCPEHASPQKVDKVLSWLEEGKDIALVTDAGTPGLSDPGAKIIKLASEVRVVPGASALTAALSLYPVSRFVFLGFPPVKNKRKKFFDNLSNYELPVVLYESSHRINKTLEEIGEREVFVCREMTKMFETTYHGLASDLKVDSRGEFVIIIL